MRRFAPFALVCAITLTLGAARAQESRLPDMGSSAARIITPAQQRGYGAMMLAQLRRHNFTLEDPLLGDWLQDVGSRLAASSSASAEPFTFFLLKERQINAFATLGGYIGVNSGLILTAEREDELAAVLAHEVSHVTQAHVLRAVERSQRDQLPILLAMLGAIVLAQTAGGGGNSAGNATMAAVAGAQGLLVQRKLDYSRNNESEADRVGIRLLARAGYDPNAMAAFFERMQSAMRANRGSDDNRAPDYLLTHPVTTTRIAEAKERAKETSTPPRLQSLRSTDNPLLPIGIQVSAAQRPTGTQFDYARERLRTLSAASPQQALREYEQMGRLRTLNDAERYGQAVAHLQAGQFAQAAMVLDALERKLPDNWWLNLAAAEADSGQGRIAAAEQRLDALTKRMPSNRAIAITYARLLSQRGSKEFGQRAVQLLRPLAASYADDPSFQSAYARAAEVAGDDVRAGEAHAEAAYLNGNPHRALLQLNTLKMRPDLDYYARARIDARIVAITPDVLDMRKQGIQDLEGPTERDEKRR